MNPEEIKNFILQLLDDKKAEDVSVIDLHKTTSLARFMIFANGRSSKNISAIVDHVAEELKKSGHPHISIEGLGHSKWVLMDAGDVILHVFDSETRANYKLEEFWDKK